MNDLTDLLRLRIVTSYLGEQGQCNWWRSKFFDPAAASFLAPLFPRTRFLAQAEGAAAAARTLHDERIGVGRVFHLFRLPEDYEQRFHQQLQDPTVISQLAPLVADKSTALEFLNSEYSTSDDDQVGPVLVGEIAEIASKDTRKAIGAAYLQGFQGDHPVFPYLRESV